MSTVDAGYRGQGSARTAAGSLSLDELAAEWVAEISSVPGDTRAMVAVALWLEGKAESPPGEAQDLLRHLPRLFYERHRAKIAEKLGVRLPALDELRRPPGAGHESTRQGTEATFDEPNPWPEPVDGGVLLDDLAGLFRKYIVLPDGAGTALALWTTFAWLHDRFQVSPLLAISSPQKRCGKTTLLALLGQLVPRPLPVANMTAASLFRTIEVFSPTVLADEADTYFFESKELRGVLTAGHMRSQARVMRCLEPDYKPRLFRVWALKAIALIGRLTGAWSTLADRSIVVQLQRKRPGERVKRMQLDRLPGETEELRQKLVRWTTTHGSQQSLLGG